MMPTVVTHYRFDGPPKKIHVVPHGNSKVGLPFHPSDNELIQKIRATIDSTTNTNAKIYQKVGNTIDLMGNTSTHVRST